MRHISSLRSSNAVVGKWQPALTSEIYEQKKDKYPCLVAESSLHSSKSLPVVGKWQPAVTSEIYEKKDKYPYLRSRHRVEPPFINILTEASHLEPPFI
jgi:hypothetical protein